MCEKLTLTLFKQISLLEGITANFLMKKSAGL